MEGNSQRRSPRFPAKIEKSILYNLTFARLQVPMRATTAEVSYLCLPLGDILRCCYTDAKGKLSIFERMSDSGGSL